MSRAAAPQARLALAREGRRGRDFTYAELSAQTQSLRQRAAPGSASARATACSLLAGRIPELYVAALGTLKNGAVFSPLFSAFGPEPIAARIGIGDGKVLVTTAALYSRKVAPGPRPACRASQHVLIVGKADDPDIPGTHDLAKLMAEAGDGIRDRADRPRGHGAAALHQRHHRPAQGRGARARRGGGAPRHRQLALDLHPEDVFWCTADPGWVTGTSYGIIAPLTNGVTMIVDEADFDAERWYGILQDQRVTVWYTAPTAIRMLMKVGEETVAQVRPVALRFMASVGEPLNPEAVVWGDEAFGLPFHDNWWQTETGGIMIANYRRHGHQARLDGPAAARHRGRHRRARTRTAA